MVVPGRYGRLSCLPCLLRPCSGVTLSCFVECKEGFGKATRSRRTYSCVMLQAEGGQAGMQAQQPGAIRGYGVVNTPAFTPGPDASPLMTWGDIGSTPIRLDQEDDIHVSTSTGGYLLQCGLLLAVPRCSHQCLYCCSVSLHLCMASDERNNACCISSMHGDNICALVHPMVHYWRQYGIDAQEDSKSANTVLPEPCSWFVSIQRSAVSTKHQPDLSPQMLRSV